MKTNKIFLAATGSSLTKAVFESGSWQVSEQLNGVKINAFAVDKEKSGAIYIATQKHGVLKSEDSGASWKSIGLKNTPVKSVAVNYRSSDGTGQLTRTIYAGCKPVSLYVSEDEGETWRELEGLRRARRWWWFSPAEPPEWTPYVQALSISPEDPNVILAGIELGGVLRSDDGGHHWSGHLRGAGRDCHSIKFHGKSGKWIYMNSGSGPSFSQDGGYRWKKAKAGLGIVYGWMVAADPQHPEIWYQSSSGMSNLLKGEFTPPAHNDGNARAHIYRTIAGKDWEQLSGGLPEPLNYMAYALITDPEKSGHLYAGLANGDVWHTEDYGDTWGQLPFNLISIHNSMIMI
jgi:hypothetical protein